MAIRLYNTLTRRRETLETLVPGEIRMYVCGVTVYDRCHVGHARSAIVFDVIRRWLEYRGYRVTFVKNFTDVDDKIIRRAQEEGVSPADLAERHIAEYRTDMDALGVRAADFEPKATEHIPQMKGLIERLLAKGFAYEVDGDVYFEVRRFRGYGRLSRKNLEELLVGARVEVDERKRDPRDFALWKSAKPGEPWWNSPWGRGRPGWHIECSAMSMEYLGESFDLHGGGEDLVFPHHECEIAQSEAATGKPFARYWIHNAFVNMGAEKMSKSLGNVLTIRDLTRRWEYHPEALRLYLLRTHYRSPLEFLESGLVDAHQALMRWVMLIGRASLWAGAMPPGTELGGDQLNASVLDDLLTKLRGSELEDETKLCCARFGEAMDDDFNTAQAVGAIFDLDSALQRHSKLIEQSNRPPESLLAGVTVLQLLGRVLGLLWWQINPFELPGELRAQIDPLIAEREEARRRRDWKRADELRVELDALGVVVEDTPRGPRPRRKSPSTSPQ